MTDFPWTEAYPPGMRWDMVLPVSPVQQILDDAADRWPDHTALSFMGRKMSYRQLRDSANQAAKGFQALGVKPGVHVGLYLPNTPHYLISFFGILKAGGSVVNYSPLDAERVLGHKIEDSQTDFIVTLDLALLYPQMGQMLGQTRLQKIILGSVAQMSAEPDAVHAHLQQSGQLATVALDARHVSFDQLLGNDGVFQAYPISDPATELAVLQYTGGTTGLPKGAILTHGNLTAATAQITSTTNGGVLEEGKERLLAVLPLFHIYALTIDMLFGLRIGAELVLHTKFELAAVIKEIATRKITMFPGVPSMYSAIVHYADIGQYDLGSLKYCGSGGAPLPVEVNQRFQQLTGCNLLEGWGMTETSATGTFTPAQGLQKIGSCGVPLPGIMIRFADVDDATQTVASGERGELCIKGPNVMHGYWNNPAATKQSMTHDGYFRTGDVATIDADGFIYIVDRTKDMILCGGFNVYPRIVEEAIYEHPAVAEVTVIGIHDAYRGESPKAFIVLKAGAQPFTLDEMKLFLKGRLGKHEMLRAMDIRLSLPKTPVGKLSKKELYEEEAGKRPVQLPDSKTAATAATAVTAAPRAQERR
jgi:long-chain acyl-CoA synthetase